MKVGRTAWLAALLAGAWISAGVAEPSPKFDPDAVARLLARRERLGGLTTEDRMTLIQVIGTQLHMCWTAPPGSDTACPPRIPVIEIMLKPDGSLAAEPRVANGSADPLFQKVAASAIRAVKPCAPLRIPAELRPYYEDWKRLLVNFDPRGRR